MERYQGHWICSLNDWPSQLECNFGLRGSDGARLFVWEFFKIFKKDNKALKILKKEILQYGIQKLATFRIDPKSTEFPTLVNEILGPCEFLTFDHKDTCEMTLDQFRNFIQKIYLKI